MVQAINFAISQGLDKIEELRDALSNDWIDRNETMRLLNSARVRVQRLKNLRALLGQRAVDRCNRRYGHLQDCNGSLKMVMNDEIRDCQKRYRETGNTDAQVRFLTARGLK